MRSSGKSPPKPQATPLITLMGLHPLLPLRFPTLSELAQAPSVSPPSSSDSGLFSTLVGHPEHMLDDLLRDPEKYEEGVAELLQSLVAGSKSLQRLSMEERDLLDRATLDLNRSSYKKPSPPLADSSAPKTPEKSSESSSEEKEEGLPKEKVAQPKEKDQPADDLAVPDWLK